MRVQGLVESSGFGAVSGLGADAAPPADLSASRAIFKSRLVALPFVDAELAEELLSGLETVVEEAADRKVRPLILKTVALSVVGSAVIAFVLSRR